MRADDRTERLDHQRFGDWLEGPRDPLGVGF
jgi:hypothetical protein